MAATTPTLSVLLLISLLAFSTTGSIATYIDPLTIPSCIGHPSLLKCAHDIQFSLMGVGYAKIGSEAHTTSLVLDSINAAKSSYINVLHIESNIMKSLQSAFHIAIHELSDASKVLHGKSSLSSSELKEVLNFLNIAKQNVVKFIAILSHPKTDINSSLRSLIDQSINVTALSLKICRELSGKVSVGSRHH